MMEPTSAGRTKLDAAVEAAHIFLDQLYLEAGDQAAVVIFNYDAWLLTPLTGRRRDLDLALSGLQWAPQTRIERGIEVARQELASVSHRVSNVPVMIVLTDGRANPGPPELAIREADEANLPADCRESAVYCQAILGPEIDSRGPGSVPWP